MDGLINRLKAATGPDRHLDADIHEASGGGHTSVILEAFLPRYTGSIDAALTLVPDGFKWKLGYSRHVPCVATLVDYRPHAPVGRSCGTFYAEVDSNHSIALCIAAIMAREPTEKSP